MLQAYLLVELSRSAYSRGHKLITKVKKRRSLIKPEFHTKPGQNSLKKIKITERGGAGRERKKLNLYLYLL